MAHPCQFLFLFHGLDMRDWRRVVVSGLPLYLTAVQALASAPGPPDVPDRPNPVAHPTFSRALVNELQLGPARVLLEKTTLTDLAKRFPGTHIYHSGDAGHSETWVCYTLSDPSGGFRIWLDSGELEGGNAIDGVVAAVGTGSPRSDCPNIQVEADTVGLDSGIWLGAPTAAVRRRLGPPSRIYRSVQHYDFHTPAAGKTKDCSADGGIALDIQDGRVVRLWANNTTSC